MFLATFYTYTIKYEIKIQKFEFASHDTATVDIYMVYNMNKLFHKCHFEATRGR